MALELYVFDKNASIIQSGFVHFCGRSLHGERGLKSYNASKPAESDRSLPRGERGLKLNRPIQVSPERLPLPSRGVTNQGQHTQRVYSTPIDSARLNLALTIVGDRTRIIIPPIIPMIDQLFENWERETDTGGAFTTLICKTLKYNK